MLDQLIASFVLDYPLDADSTLGRLVARCLGKCSNGTPVPRFLGRILDESAKDLLSTLYRCFLTKNLNSPDQERCPSLTSAGPK
jgi:hypothetical protein